MLAFIELYEGYQNTAVVRQILIKAGITLKWKELRKLNRETMEYTVKKYRSIRKKDIIKAIRYYDKIKNRNVMYGTTLKSLEDCLSRYERIECEH
jgi:hypothetical protein